MRKKKRKVNQHTYDGGQKVILNTFFVDEHVKLLKSKIVLGERVALLKAEFILHT